MPLPTSPSADGMLSGSGEGPRTPQERKRRQRLEWCSRKPSPSSKEIKNFKQHLALFPHSFRALRVTWARPVSFCPQGYWKTQAQLFCKLIFPTVTWLQELRISERSCTSHKRVTKVDTFHTLKKGRSERREGQHHGQAEAESTGQGTEAGTSSGPHYATSCSSDTAKLEETSAQKHRSKSFTDSAHQGQHRSKTRGITHLPGPGLLVGTTVPSAPSPSSTQAEPAQVFLLPWYRHAPPAVTRNTLSQWVRKRFKEVF